jgi:cysteine desulfurase
MQRIYLDHNATSPPRALALKAAWRAGRASWANPASPHGEGRVSRAVLEEARRRVARLAGVDGRAVFFTSGGTEAAHAALQGVARAAGPGRVVISEIEHPSIIAAARALEREGYRVVAVPPGPDGVVDAERFLSACAPGTVAAALMVAHNEFGTLQPVDQVASGLGKAGVPLIADAVQAAGRLPRPLPAGEHVLGIFSAHKIGGLAGAGAVSAAPDLRLVPVLGGGEQERGRRSGSPPLSLVAAMGAAAAEVAGEGREVWQAVARLRDRFEAGLRARARGITVIGQARPRLPNTCGFLADGIRGGDLVAALDLAGIAVAAGSACSTGSTRAPAAVMALGLDHETARCFARVSLGRTTTEEEVETALERILVAMEKLRRHAGPNVRRSA